MITLVRLTAVVVLALVPIVSCAPQQVDEVRVAQAQPPTEQQEEFIPIDQLPPQEQLPAAPLLVGAYAFVLLMLFAYMVTVSRRLTAIQREVDRLESDLKRTGSN
jgi:CcmD family protein